MTVSWHLSLYKHVFDVHIWTQRRILAPTWSLLLGCLLPFVLLTAEAQLEFSIFIHLLYHYPLFFPMRLDLLCTLSIFICYFMLYCSLTLHFPKALVFYIKHTCLLVLSERGQFPPFKGFSPLVLQFPLSRRAKSYRMLGLIWLISAPYDICPLKVSPSM